MELQHDNVKHKLISYLTCFVLHLKRYHVVYPGESTSKYLIKSLSVTFLLMKKGRKNKILVFMK